MIYLLLVIFMTNTNVIIVKSANNLLIK